MNMVLVGPGEHMPVEAAERGKVKLTGECTEELTKEAGEDGGARA